MTPPRETTGAATAACLAELREAIAALRAVYGRLPVEALRTHDVGAWGPLEVLCHLVFWHEQYGAIAAALRAGTPAPLQSGSFPSLNARAVTENRDDTLDELLDRLARAQRRLEEVVRSAGGMEGRIAFKQGGRERPFPEALHLVARHIQGHGESLRRAWLPRRRARPQQEGSPDSVSVPAGR